MCVYKLARVEFKYWGLQTRVENFILAVGLRKTLLVCHRQVYTLFRSRDVLMRIKAWCWQDEWFGITLEEVLRKELETIV